MEDLFLILDSEDKSSFKSTIRSFFAQILKFLYRWMESAVDAIYTLAQANLGLGEWVESLSEKIFVALIIFMIFKVTLSIMTYLVNPDAFNDKSKGFQNIIKRIIIVLMLLISINPIFDFLHKFQDDLLEDGVVENLVLGTGNDTYFETSDGDRVYLIQISPYCEEWAPEHRTITFSRGESLALLALKPFIQPVNENEGDVTERKEDLLNLNYCGADYSGEIAYIESSEEAFRNSIIGPSSAGDYLKWEYYNGYTGDWSLENNVYYLDFDYLWALVSGAVIFLLALTFCFDVVKRSLTLMVLQVMAPIPIISYVSPEGKSSNLLSTWFKKVGSTWVSLFIRLLALSFAISFIGAVCNSETFRNNEHGAIMQMIVIAGTLMFAKGLPKLLEEIIPGLKFDGGLELNPFKRISKEALGGNQLLGLGAAAIGAGLSGVTNGVQRGIEGISDLRKNGVSAGRVLGHVGRTFGSGIAGATRGGINAFGRTSKDGKLFSGAWNGYQTSMFSKKLREDNLRKAGLENAGFLERAEFGIGSMVSDLARYAGVLNRGQKEDLVAAEEDAYIKQRQDDLDLRKYNLSQEKYKALEPYQQYATLATKIKSRIDNSKAVKDAEEELANARAIGDPKQISDAEFALKETKKFVANELYNKDDDVKDLVERMGKLRSSNSELASKTDLAFKFNEDTQQYEFESNSIYGTQNQSSIIERKFEERERILKNEQEEINEQKRNFANDEAHNAMSQAKLQNASRMNNKPEDPGFKATPNQSSQASIQDNSLFNNLGNNGNDGGTPIPPPPPRGRR